MHLLEDYALQKAADENGGYIDAKTVRIVKAALAVYEADRPRVALFWAKKLRKALNQAKPNTGETP